MARKRLRRLAAVTTCLAGRFRGFNGIGGCAVSRAFWAVELTGQSTDLADWQALLQEPFEPRAESLFALGLMRTVLKSSEFEKMTTASEVRERALIMTENLNGALSALWRTGRVELGSVLEVDTNGRVGATAFVESLSYRLRGRPATMVVGTNSPTIPQPSAAQKWVAHAMTDDVVADMLIHFGKEPHWYDLYKSFEGVRDLCGGEMNLKQKSWVPPKLKSFTRTANYYRHGLGHPARKTPPPNPMSLEEATELIAGMVRSIMSELAP
jgi:hypothetical protein